jgi:predicted histidine transporter YuiF (NhaC family)
MGKGSARVNGASEEMVGRVSGEIDTLRRELGALVGELDRRRHEAFDLGLQVRKHPVAVAVAAATLALAVGGLIALVVAARRERRRPSTRVRETRRALQRIMQRPHEVGRDPSIPRKVVAAIATAAAATLAKRLVQRQVPSAPRNAR